MHLSFKEEDGLFAVADCADWLDFKVKAQSVLNEKYSGEESKFLFRGHGSSDWKLASSFDRRFEGELSPAELDALYSRRMRTFEKNFEIYGNISMNNRGIRLPSSDTISETMVEALAQHYGLSTRLLDWSSSLYVASFFAFSGANLSTTGLVSVFVLNRSAFDHFSTDHLEHITDFYEQNVRNLWQMGSFSRNRTTTRDLEGIFQCESKYYRASSSRKPLLIRFDIPAAEQDTALADLSMMRINSMTIFPGIEGVVKWIEDGC